MHVNHVFIQSRMDNCFFILESVTSSSIQNAVAIKPYPTLSLFAFICFFYLFNDLPLLYFSFPQTSPQCLRLADPLKVHKCISNLRWKKAFLNLWIPFSVVNKYSQCPRLTHLKIYFNLCYGCNIFFYCTALLLLTIK